MKPFDPAEVRSLFPALHQTVNGAAPVFFDGPGGTQVPESVLKAMNSYFLTGSSNLIASEFFSVRNARAIVSAARENGAAFFNAPSAAEVIFGANATTITAHLSRSISREWQAGDEIILTDLDHAANISFWKQAAEDRGVTWRTVRARPEDCTLDYEHYESLLSRKTKFVAFAMASNVCGSLVDAARMVKGAQSVGALTWADAVHYAPHFLPDVQKTGCDFMSCSPYKFFGPHMGMVYGRRAHLERLRPYKVEPAPPAPPECWETGTQSFEALAGFNATIAYLASLGEGASLRQKLQSGYERVMAYEQRWGLEFLRRAADIPGLRVWGIADAKRMQERTATFAITRDAMTPLDLSDHLSRNSISAGAGSFYGNGVTRTLGLEDKGGVVRIGCVHYNTLEEMDRLFTVLQGL